MKAHRLWFVFFLSFLLIVPCITRTNSISEEYSKPHETYVPGNLIPHDTIWINGDAMFHEQAALEEWPGSGTREDPYLISGYYFNTWDKPLTIYHSSLYWIFTNNLIDGEDDHGGTWIQNCTNGAIVDNEICNRRFAIAVASGSGINISGNYIHDCWENGIEFMAGMNNALVYNNTIENIGVAGFYSGLSRNSTIANNTVTKCGSYGVALLGVMSNCTITGNSVSFTGNETIGGIGMQLMIFDTSNVTFNEITNCTSHGILINTGNRSSIISNTITNSSGYAIALFPDANQIVVKFNEFIDNGFDCQVLDNGTLNEFTHNYYNDWTSPDVNQDGYVDVPYSIDGISSNSDLFPLTNAGILPTGSSNNITENLVLLSIIGGLVISLVIFGKRRKV